MARCEDFPCCGHELGCCPNYDESGRQVDMVCVCGARLPVNNRYSICNRCLRDSEDLSDDPRWDMEEPDYDDPRWDEDDAMWEDCNEHEPLW